MKIRTNVRAGVSGSDRCGGYTRCGGTRCGGSSGGGGGGGGGYEVIAAAA